MKAAAAQLSAVDLEDALSVALLVIEHEPYNTERTAVRWLGHWALESKQADLAGLLEAPIAMSAPPHEPERWEAVLRQLVR